MQISIRDDFGGIEMGHHRGDLLQRLDHVLGQLDHGLEHLKHQNPELNNGHLQRMKYRYKTLREPLLETNVKAISRTSLSTITPLCVFTLVPNGHRIPGNSYVRTPSPVPVVSLLERSAFPRPTLFAPLPPRLVVSHLNAVLVISKLTFWVKPVWVSPNGYPVGTVVVVYDHCAPPAVYPRPHRVQLLAECQRIRIVFDLFTNVGAG
jgi:hypothetical protein